MGYSFKAYEPHYLKGMTVSLTEDELERYRKLKDGSYRNAPFEFEWLQKLCDRDGLTKFRIKYFGELHPDAAYPNLIVGKNFGSKEKVYIPPRIIAENAATGNEVLLFDLAWHGYNSVICGEDNEFREMERIPDQVIFDNNGNDLFEIYISVYYQINFDEAFGDEVDEKGNLTTPAEKEPFNIVKSNSFDCICIHTKNEREEWCEIAEFELA